MKDCRNPARFLLVLAMASGLTAFTGDNVRLPGGAWLGQAPPGSEPALFAPGVVSTEEFFEFSCTFTPDGGEFYFTRREGGSNRNTIYVSIRGDDGWTSPEVAGFSGTWADHEPSIPPSGGRLYWGSHRPLPNGDMSYRIWVVDKTLRGWGPPRPLNGPAAESLLMYVTFTSEDVLYSSGIVRSVPKNGEYQKVEKLGPPVNQGYFNAHPFISPDESFLIFDSNRPGNFGRSDLFISFRGSDGWSPPRNLGREINRGGWNSCPMMSPDGEWFFFSVDGDIFWVAARRLLELRRGEPWGDFSKGHGASVSILDENEAVRKPRLFTQGRGGAGGSESK